MDACSRTPFPVWSGLSLLLAVSVAGCGQPPPRTWVGTVSGSDARVAVVEEDAAFVGYVCGGDTTFATYSRWFQGTVDGGTQLSGERDGWTLAGELGDSMTGTLTAPDGSKLEIEAKETDPEDVDGLYDANDAKCRTGAIVWTGADGAASLQGTWCDDGGDYAQVTPVMPIEPTGEGIHARVDLTKLGLEVRDLYLQRVQPPKTVR